MMEYQIKGKKIFKVVFGLPQDWAEDEDSKEALKKIYFDLGQKIRNLEEKIREYKEESSSEIKVGFAQKVIKDEFNTAVEFYGLEEAFSVLKEGKRTVSDFLARADWHTHTAYSDADITPWQYIEEIYRIKNLTIQEAKELAIKKFKVSLEGVELDEFALRLANRGNELKSVAVTDHNTMEGVEPILFEQKKYHKKHKIKEEDQIEIIPGVEVDSEFMGQPVHILGYFFKGELGDYTSEFFQRLKERVGTKLNAIALGCNMKDRDLLTVKMNANKRLNVAERIERGEITKEITPGVVQLFADEQKKKLDQENPLKDHILKGPGQIHWSHLARIMVEHGYVKTLKEARSYLLWRGECNCDKDPGWYRIPAEEAVELLKKGVAGIEELGGKGMISLAHPQILIKAIRDFLIEEHKGLRSVSRIIKKIEENFSGQAIKIVEDLIEERLEPNWLRNIEIFYPEDEPGLTKQLKEFVHSAGLGVTGGSDSHGNLKTRQIGLGLGQLSVPHLIIENISRTPLVAPLIEEVERGHIDSKLRSLIKEEEVDTFVHLFEELSEEIQSLTSHFKSRELSLREELLLDELGKILGLRSECKPLKTRIIGHRGAKSYLPENTLFSFWEAIGEGATVLEMDVKISKDGLPVVFHDKDLDRLADKESEMIEEMPSEKIERVRLKTPGGSLSSAYIPTLEDVLEDKVIRGKIDEGMLTLGIEIKSKGSEGVEEKIIKLLNQHKLTRSVIISSFSPENLQRVKELNPNLRTMLLFRDNPWGNLKLAEKIKANFINPEAYCVTKALVSATRESGIKITVGETHDLGTIKDILPLGVWGIHSDSPGLIKEAKTDLMGEIQEELKEEFIKIFLEGF